MAILKIRKKYQSYIDNQNNPDIKTGETLQLAIFNEGVVCYHAQHRALTGLPV